MKSRRFGSSGVWISLVLGLALAAPGARAVCESQGESLHVENSGTGGTGLQPAEGGGAGGTGRALSQVVPTTDGGSGAGGTGLYGGDGDEGSGAGGTGILGTITGFGSICVNGLRVQYDDETPVVRDGYPIDATELAVGQVVRMDTGPGKGLVARHIAVENALSGPVTRVDRQRNRFWVMEQPVVLRSAVEVFDRVAQRTVRSDEIRPGHYVDVSGQRRADGVVVASRLEARAADRPDSATGVAVPAVGRIAYVGDLRATLPPDLAAHPQVRRVVLKGRWNAERRTFESKSVEAASPVTPGVERLSLEGFVESTPSGGDFEIAGTPVDASAFSGTPKRGDLVRVHGRVDRNGRLRAERIDLRRMAIGLQDARSNRKEKSDRSGRSGRGGRGSREERGDRSGSGRGERVDRVERGGRSERVEREDRSSRAERGERNDKSGRN